MPSSWRKQDGSSLIANVEKKHLDLGLEVFLCTVQACPDTIKPVAQILIHADTWNFHTSNVVD